MSTIACNETITTYLGVLSQYLKKIVGPEIHSLTCEMQNAIQYSWHGKFQHRAYKFRNDFVKYDNRHVSFDLTYCKTHNKVPFSVTVFCLFVCLFVFCRWVAKFGILEN